jgi:hypothetical protein
MFSLIDLELLKSNLETYYEDFRKDFQMIDKTAILIFPPSKPLKLYVEEEYKNKVLRFQNDYKVKRSKPLLRTANNLNNLLKIKE